MNQPIRLSTGNNTSHDEIAVILVEPAEDPHHRPGPSAVTPPTAATTHYPAVAAVIVRMIAESATALARYKAGGQR